MPESGWELLNLQSKFPDAKLRIKGEIYRVEFEFNSRSFAQHKHDVMGCDLVICWVHDWEECPLPVLALQDPKWIETDITKVSEGDKAVYEPEVKQNPIIAKQQRIRQRVTKLQKDLERTKTALSTVTKEVIKVKKKQIKKETLSTAEYGTVAYHIDYPEFHCEIVKANNPSARVKVISGWLGYPIPTWLVTVPLAKLVIVSKDLINP